MSAADESTSSASASGRTDEDDVVTKHESYEQKIEQLDNEIDELVRDQLLNGSEDDKSEFLRKRNALYSQRKYYRKKMRVNKLETEKTSLMRENNRLRTEQEKLERTLAWAREKVFLHEALAAQAVAPLVTLPPSFHQPVLETVCSANGGIFSRSLLEQQRQQQTAGTLPLGLGTRSSFPSTAASLAGLSAATGDNLTTSALLAAIESNQRARNDLLLLRLVGAGGANPLAASLDGSGSGSS